MNSPMSLNMKKSYERQVNSQFDFVLGFDLFLLIFNYLFNIYSIKRSANGLGMFKAPDSISSLKLIEMSARLTLRLATL